MPFSRKDCVNIPQDENLGSCVTHENEALLPNLATSQIFSSLDKIKDYTAQIKNTYHVNKINNRPSPEESEYFYDDYVDYPYNDTVLNEFDNDINTVQKVNKSQESQGVPTLYAGMKNTSQQNTTPPPRSSFTFFGMPLPAIDMGKLLNTGRKVDWTENKTPPQHVNKYQSPEPPKFETGGFSPIMPTTAGGFMPIPNPNISHTAVVTMGTSNYKKNGNIEQSVVATVTKPPVTKSHNSTTHQKIKSEIHELQAYLDDDNSTHVAYNRTKNVEEQKMDPNNLSKYNLMESNLTITQVTEKEGILITTDTTNDLSLQAWMETSSKSYSSAAPVTSKPVKKHIESDQPTALSAILVPSNEEIIKRNHTQNNKRSGTITKVTMPHAAQFDAQDIYAPVINREAKTRFTESIRTGDTKLQQINDKDWYYKNYNNSNLEPYIAPGVHDTSNANSINRRICIMSSIIMYYLANLLIS